MHDEPHAPTDELTVRAAERLGRVRGHMSDAEFAQLLADVARTADRFREIDAGRLKPSRRRQRPPK